MESEKKGTGESTPSNYLMAFYCFAKDRRPALEQENAALKNNFEQLVILLNSEFENMPLQEKNQYAEEAAEKLAEERKNPSDKPHPHDKIYEYLATMKTDNAERFPELKWILNRKKNSLISSIYAPPYGQSTTAIMMHINFFVEMHPVYVPLEIAVAAFSLTGGLLDSFSTFVKPGKIPEGFGTDAHNSATKYDVSLQYENEWPTYYEKIVDELETFFKKHEIQGKGEAYIFCPANMHKGAMFALERLYHNGNREFKRNLHFLESLIITLSLGGLETIANETSTDLHSVIMSVQSVVKHCASLTKAGVSLSIDDVLSKSGFTNIDESNYSEIGSCSRRASLRLDQPNAVIGAFLFEQQVTDYFRCMDYGHLQELGCEYHAGGSTSGSPALIYCALSTVKRFVYLALDVLMVNYGIQPLKGLHYPNTA